MVDDTSGAAMRGFHLLMWSLSSVAIVGCTESSVGVDSTAMITAGSSSSTPEPTTSTVLATTTVQSTTTTLAAPTTETLFFLMPAPLDLPPGWTSTGGMPDGSLTPKQGDYVSICGGANGDLRAQNNRVLAAMAAPRGETPEGANFYFTVYAFPTETDAKSMLADTLAQASCGYREFTMAEAEFDHFGGTGFSRVKWTVRETTSAGSAGIDESGNAFIVKVDTEYFARTGGTDYGGRETDVILYESHGRFVLVSKLFGRCCEYGYSDVGSGRDVTPTLEQLLGGMKSLRPLMLQRLRDARLLN